MTLWAIVPVKPLAKGKTRLAGVLNPAERYALNRQMLEHLLSTLARVPEIERTLVVSRDSAVLALARDRRRRPDRTRRRGAQWWSRNAVPRRRQVSRSFSTAAAGIADDPSQTQAQLRSRRHPQPRPPVRLDVR